MHHRAVDRFEAAFHLTAQFSNFTLDSVEAIADIAEAPVYVRAKIIQSRICPALSHHVHDCTVNISAAHVARRVSDLCHADLEVAAVDSDGGTLAGVEGNRGSKHLGGDVGLVGPSRCD